MRDFLAGGGGVDSESGWVRLGCLRVGGSGLGCWRLAEGGGDISVSRREFLRCLRLDGARGAGGGNSLEGRGGDGGEACVVVSSSARGWENVWDCVMLGGAGEVGLFGLGGAGWLSGGDRGRCRLLWG